MPYWNTRGLRGSKLEQLIDFTNNFYNSKNIALVNKIPTPITPVAIDSKSRLITKAFFEKKGTVDYVGIAQGIPICFDAKETDKKFLPLTNIHKHQIDFMGRFQNHGGIAFFIVYFHMYNQAILAPLNDIKPYFSEGDMDKKTKIFYESLDKRLIIRESVGVPLNYLNAVNVYMDMEKENK
jgi:recombination protein U